MIKMLFSLMINHKMHNKMLIILLNGHTILKQNGHTILKQKLKKNGCFSILEH